MRTVPQRTLMARRMRGVMAWRKAATQPVSERNHRPDARRTPVRKVVAPFVNRMALSVCQRLLGALGARRSVPRVCHGRRDAGFIVPFLS